MQRVTRAIIACACDKSAVGLYGDLDRLRKLKVHVIKINVCALDVCQIVHTIKHQVLIAP
jgi:hypothetical protein